MILISQKECQQSTYTMKGQTRAEYLFILHTTCPYFALLVYCQSVYYGELFTNALVECVCRRADADTCEASNIRLTLSHTCTNEVSTKLLRALSQLCVSYTATKLLSAVSQLCANRNTHNVHCAVPRSKLYNRPGGAMWSASWGLLFGRVAHEPRTLVDRKRGHWRF